MPAAWRDRRAVVAGVRKPPVDETARRIVLGGAARRSYPVERVLTIRLPAGAAQWRIVPFFDDQELDSRATGGPVYWEGAVRTEGGRGYLELTGYLEPLKF